MRNMGRRGVNCHPKINDGIMRPKNYILVNSLGLFGLIVESDLTLLAL